AWLCVAERLPKSEITCAIANGFRVDKSVAAEWLRASIEKFEGAGLLAAEETNSAVNNVVQKTATNTCRRAAERTISVEHRLPIREYRVFERFVRIAAPPRLHPALESLMGGLRTDLRPNLDGDAVFSLEISGDPTGWRITLGDELVARC